MKLKTIAAIALLAAALPAAQSARAASQVIATIKFDGPVAANPRQARAGQPTPKEVIRSLSNAAFSTCKRVRATVTRVDLIKMQATSANTTGVWQNVRTRWNCVATN
ncbi:hypothetical protein [Xanthomonas arboricola]|uniref:UrcA family protein n=1 Tax=Xanthomonas arboricola pv. guizotiae TaxID=487867 RepID=A0A2S6ZT45_9XANT|nr:hypothetical protein [Xanthomonas arboricola]PPT95610.1 hypothetical protein XarbCFBP7409_17240 [Xanthomonas arboricola pv. guizotiae]PPU19594.1 hypothetical protein XarbCFBP7408_18920 [Xanthomonas arboricola pv. guizotiae]